MKAYLFGALLFMIGIVILIIQNDTLVAVRFLTWQSTQISLAVVVIVSACAGALITFLLEGFRAFKNSQQLRRLTKANRNYELEIQQLKAKQVAASSSLVTAAIEAPTSPAGPERGV